MENLNLKLDGISASEWADQQIGELISGVITEVAESNHSADDKEKMIVALIRRQNASLDKAGADRIWDSPEHFFDENEIIGWAKIQPNKGVNT